MALFNFVVNLLGVVLWSNWVSSAFDPLAKTTAATLAGTLKPAAPRGRRRWQYLGALGVLLLARAWLCLQISQFADWTPGIRLGLIVLSFRGDFKTHMLVFSLLSFAVVLAGFYLWLLLLSLRKAPVTGENPLRKLVRLHLQWLDRPPVAVKLAFPFLLGAVAWLALHPLLSAMDIVPPISSTRQLAAQAAVIGAGTYLSWKYLVAGLLLLQVIQSYVHLGGHPFWRFVDDTARTLLWPLRWLPLQVGRVDLLPPLAAVAVLTFCLLLDHPPAAARSWLGPLESRLYERLPF